MIRSMRVSSNVTMALLLALGSPFSSGVTQRVSSAPVAITSVTVLPMDRGHVIAGQTVVIVERAVVEQKRAGYDFVKLHGNLSREADARLNAVARREGIRLVGHAPRNLGVAVMFEERQYAVAHAEEFLYDRSDNSRDSDLAQIEAQIPNAADFLGPGDQRGVVAVGQKVEHVEALLEQT